MSSTPGTDLDWNAARERLATRHAALESRDRADTEGARRVLEERARALARPDHDEERAARPLPVVVFALGGERWALPLERVREVRRLREVTPVPCTPPFICGVTAMRSRVVAVLDLRRLLQMPGHGLSDRSCALVVGDGDTELALLGESVTGLETLDAARLAAELPGVAGQWPELVLGVAPDATVVLDARRLLHDPRLAVDARPKPVATARRRLPGSRVTHGKRPGGRGSREP